MRLFLLLAAVITGSVTGHRVSDGGRQLIARYNFSKYSKDKINDNSEHNLNANLIGDAKIIDDPDMGKILDLNGSGYMQLPANILKGTESYTISMFVKIKEFSTWARLFDFCSSPSQYIFFSPSGFGDKMIWDTNDMEGVSSVNMINVLPLRSWFHITFSYGNGVSKIYLNGHEILSSKTRVPKLMNLWRTTQNYIGKSQFSADPNIKAQFSDIRIWSRAIEANEVEELVKGKLNSDIKEVSEVDISLKVGDHFNLPKTVPGKTTDGKSVDVMVFWDDVDLKLLKRDGEFVVEGRVGGSDIIAKAHVHVKSLSMSSKYSIDININTSMSSDGERSIDTIFDVIKPDGGDGKLELIVEFYEDGKLFNSVIEEVKIDSISNSFTVNSVVESSYRDLYYDVRAYVTEVNETKKSVISYPGVKYIKPLGIVNEVETQYVQLSEDTLFGDSQEIGLEYLFRLDPDRLMAPIYQALRKSPKGRRYGGWEARQIAGHSLGHYLSALADFYAATGSPDAKEKMDYVVNELKSVQRADGYIGGVPSNPFDMAFKGKINAQGFSLNGYWVPWYSVHKIYAGLIDAYKIGGNETALEVVLKMADWVSEGSKNMTDNQFQTMLLCEYGGMNEVMADLYAITKEDKYLYLAKRFTQDIIIDPLAKGIDELQGLHANTQIPKIIGAAKIYELTGDEYYGDAVRFFYDTVINHRSFVIGGNSVSEHFGASDLEVLSRDSCETCNTYNMMKLAEHVFSWDKDSDVLDYYERALYNHILASQDPETGAKTYFVSTYPGHFKIYGTDENSFWCCTGTGMENPGRYNRFIYFVENDDLYINLFIPSTLEIQDKGIDITQSGNFPYSDKTVVNVNKLTGVENLKIRVPYWIDGSMTVTVGDDIYTASEDGYISITREWKEGDKIEITTPMGLHLYESMDSKNKVSYMYGPIVLAAQLGTENFPKDDIIPDHLSLMGWGKIDVPNIITNDNDISRFITLTDAEKFEFELSGDVTDSGESIKLVPFYDLHHERYTIYFKQFTEAELNDGVELFQSRDDIYESITTDVVKIGEQQSEIEHDFISQNSETGYLASIDLRWRHAINGGYFQYTMESQNNENSALMVTYYDKDVSMPGARREFYIKVNDTVIAEVTLKGSGNDEVIDVIYDLPLELLESAERSGDKCKLNVRFEPKDRSEFVGGIFEIRTIQK